MAMPKKQSFKKRHVSHGKAFVVCSYNNTVITITDLNGNVLGWASSGALGFKGPKKSTPFAATLVAQKAVEKTARYGLKEVDVLIKGVGGGREASVRALGNAGWMIHSIKDVTPVPHNGCRSKKPRRV
ncbi:MAG: 30S ribosomal protein S11 [Candidatus Moraniibacteriota bacterium]